MTAGKRVGVLGGGQLGRMLALAGHPLGLRFRLLDPSPEACAGQVAPLVVGAFDDGAALDEFAAGLDVVTYEFENVPLAAARKLAEKLKVYPPPRALEVAQDRLNEKNFFREHGIPVPDFAPIDSRAEFDAAVARIGFPSVLKTRRDGYDGKGQFVLKSREDADAAWGAIGGKPLILEAFVPFERELSILAVRSRRGEAAFYPLVENRHREGILRLSLAPTEVDSGIQREAEAHALRAMEALDYAGVLAIEFFQAGGKLLANEMAPRVHNSGHWTIEGAETSQFENHLRAILSWPLGSTAARGFSAMMNFIGAVPPIEDALQVPNVHAHYYGKSPQPGRKVGHATLRCETAREREAGLGRLLALEKAAAAAGREEGAIKNRK